MKTKNRVAPLLPGRYGRMSAAELDEDVAKFDQEFIAETAKALTTKERIRDRRASQKCGRLSVGNGVRRVLVTIESSLLALSDAFAAKHGLTRSALIARGLEELLRKTADRPGAK